MPSVDVDGTRLHYTDTGAPPGRPDAETIVFGHGLLFSGWMFHPQVEALGDEYRCVTLDWRGQGSTPAGPADGSRGFAADMDTLTADLVALLDHLGLDRVHYVGLSMGGFVGIRLAARHPERVASLALLDTSAGPEDPEKVSQYRLLATIYRWLGIGPVSAKVERLMFGPALLASSRRPAVTGPWMDTLRSVDRKGMRAAILGVTDREAVLDLLGSVRTPTLVLVGADDVATPPAKAQVLADGIADAKLEVVADCGHSSTVEQPEEVSRLLREHLTRVG